MFSPSTVYKQLIKKTEEDLSTLKELPTLGRNKGKPTGRVSWDGSLVEVGPCFQKNRYTGFRTSDFLTIVRVTKESSRSLESWTLLVEDLRCPVESRVSGLFVSRVEKLGKDLSVLPKPGRPGISWRSGPLPYLNRKNPSSMFPTPSTRGT